MKPEELRVGNFVFDVDEPHKVTGIDSTAIEIQNPPPYTASHPQLWDFIKPIPLNEQWLKKFGFHRQTSDHYYIFHKEKVLFTIYNGSLVIEGGYMPLELKYVHQLQNLYFALTGEELEIVRSLDHIT